jgi:uncharacterized protein
MLAGDMADLAESHASSLAATPDERTWGMLAHLLSFVAAYIALGFVAPLLVLVIKGPSPGFIREHATESLNFQLSTLIWVAVAGAVAMMTLGIGLLAVIPAAALYGVFYVVVVILGGLAANQGRSFRYPLTIRLVKP